MRRGIAIVAFVAVVLAGTGLAVGAYRAGERNGIEQGIEQVQDAEVNGTDVQVVRVVGDRYGPGFFPFGFFLFPLFLIGTFFLIGALFRRGRGGGPWHGGPWGDPAGRERFEERARAWHRREHESPAPPEPAAPGAATG